MKYLLIKYGLVLCASTWMVMAGAQQTYFAAPQTGDFIDALDFYHLGLKQPANLLFEIQNKDVPSMDQDLTFLRALTAESPDYKLISSGLLDAIQEWPQHPMVEISRLDLGYVYFRNQQDDESLEQLKKVEKEGMSIENQDQYFFTLGYLLFRKNELQESMEMLQKSMDLRGQYYHDASFYLATIYYQLERIVEAQAILELLDEQEDLSYKSGVTTMLAAIYYRRGQYEQLYRFGFERIDNKTTDTNRLLNQLIGEASFRQKKFELASKYLQRYVDLSMKGVNATTHYKLGYSYFELKDLDNAIAHFKLSALEENEMGQISSFYLGQLYLDQENLNYAYSAFKNVTEIVGNEALAQEALFAMGTINMQRGQYSAAIADLNQFQSSYPDSKWLASSNELLTQAYLNTSNYSEAIVHLEAIRNKSTKMKTAFQLITLQQGQLLFNDGKFAEAIQNFEKSLKFPMDKSLAAMGWFLKGESYSILNQQTNGQKAYQEVLKYKGSEWANRAYYGLGYLHYNSKEYERAGRYFRQYLESSFTRDNYSIDARLRLADCFYIQKEYRLAIQNYQQVEEEVWQPYVHFQIGLIYSLTDKISDALNEFDLVLKQPANSFADNALFQSGLLLVQESEFNRAIIPFKRLLERYPNSDLIPHTKAKMALCYFNMEDLDEAQVYYEDILKNHIAHEVANGALLGLQEIRKKGKMVAGFETYMSQYQEANPDDNSLEVIGFEDAKSSYYAQKYTEAINKLTSFLSTYPSSSFTVDAYYFLADSYYRIEKWQEAVTAFDRQLAQSSPYSIRAMDKKGKALIALRQFDGAIMNYLKLMERASNEKETFTAREGLMQSYFSYGKVDSALYYADRILESDFKPVNAANSAWLVKGKVFIRQKNFGPAFDELIKVVNNARNEDAVEAKYLIAEAFFMQKQYKRSLEILFDLNRNFGAYPFWIGKSFLLIADNYVAMDEILQARATIQSVIENATIPSIIRQASQKLKEIEAAEARVLAREDSTLNDTAQ